LTGTGRARACACACRLLRQRGLRAQVHPEGVWAADLPGFVQGLITNIYLSTAEYDLLASLPAAALSKTRLSIPPLSVDVFDPPLHGLVMADAEFSTDKEAHSFLPPQTAVAEVTDDPRFTGGSLVRARRHDLLACRVCCTVTELIAICIWSACGRPGRRQVP
jgi:hypothetical protein